MLVSSIPVLTGLLTILHGDFLTFGIGFVLIGVVFSFLSIKFVPYCYKIEVDSEKIYIIKTETLILTKFEKTIEIDKSKLISINKGLFGLQVAFWSSDVFYLKFSEPTEYGSKIAFLTQMKFDWTKSFEEL